MLPDLVYSYNHTIHRSIKKKPADVTADNEKQVWHTLYDDRDEVKHVKYKFNIGDHVRISKIKRTFEKGYLPMQLLQRDFYREQTNSPRSARVQIERLRRRRIERDILRKRIAKSDQIQ